MNTEQAREIWLDAGFDYSVLTVPKVEMLVGLLSIELSSFAMDGGMEMSVGDKTIWKDGDLTRTVWCEISVNGPYFSNREAITFNRDGSIGFAGWATTNNLEPFIKAFVLWVEWLKEVAE